MKQYKGKNVVVLASYLILLIGLVYLTVVEKLLYLANLLSIIILTQGITELINMLFNQKKYISTTHSQKTCWWKFRFDYASLLSYITVISALFVISMTWFFNAEGPFRVILDGNELLFTVTFGTLLSYINLEMDESTVNKGLTIHKLKGIDYGSGMANSYFHGYLKIVLPNGGGRYDKGIKDGFKDYEAKHNVKFGIYKLFILIPSSLYCPNSLASGSSTSVEVGGSLESKKIDRAGVQNRSYKISVYKITKQPPTNHQTNRKVYVAAEYATPVKTLLEVMNTNSPYADLYRKYLTYILFNFYQTLQNLLKGDPECHEVCEVIYFNDKNKRGRFYDVGKIILARMEQLHRKS